MNRATFLSILASSTAGAVLGCRSATEPTAVTPSALPSRLLITPKKPSLVTAPGMHTLDLGIFRDGRLYVPSSYKPSEPLPLLVLLHGLGDSGSSWFGPYAQLADAARMIVLAPDARFVTWDAVSDDFERFGEDVAFIASAMNAAFDRVAIDAKRMALFGFADGASYALSLGLANGDLFPHIAAFTPGYIVEQPRLGTPRFFVSHGLRDTLYPIELTSRRLVPALRGVGYEVQYTEFDGGHGISPETSSAAMSWLIAGQKTVSA